MSARIAVLASGNGSNLQALLDYFAFLGDRAPGRIVLVASNNPHAFALDRARRLDIETVVLDPAGRSTGLLPLLSAHAITLVVLAGYLRLVPADAASAFRGRLLNVHPALLPAFGGEGTSCFRTRV